MFGVSVLVSTFVRSGVIATNDLGWRGFLPAQFVMLLWGAEFLMRRGERAMADGKPGKRISQLVAAQSGLGAVAAARRVRHSL